MNQKIQKIIFFTIFFCFLILSVACGDKSNDDKNIPTVTLTATPNTGKAALDVTFTANASVKGGSIVSYEWDFEGKGTYSGNTATNTAKYVYNFNGVYIAKVKVTDNIGNTATATATVNVAN